jgi:Amt family ammonium transporter
MKAKTRRMPGMLAVLLMAGAAGTAWGQEAGAAAAEAAPAVSPEMFTTNNLWMMVATFLVFIMHLGFATVESGLTRAKNTVNILFKNTLIPAIGLLTYALTGFALMYQGDWAIPGWLRLGFGVGTDAAGLTSAYNAGYTYWTDFLFQGMFAATAATIVSGAVAERVKLGSFLIFSTVYVALGYTIAGSWVWGGGWLSALNFHDFAGSTLVHSVGGWGALAGVILLGPRLGKYTNGGIRPIMATTCRWW